ncbi:MAG TPA: protein-glutamate O-methyltransferase CheR [Kofleriaceae bacterium]|nr:protein-glutamate O-methyltransferase CheR [Kofleriaceae bacterium]
MAKPTGMPLSPASLARVRERIAEHAGLQLPQWVLEARLAARLAALRLPDGDDYADLVSSPGGRRELDALLESVRVGETRFFRHPAHVAAVTEVVIPALRARGAARVRGWSAGCATGEEAYTLAMALRDPAWEVAVLASDLSAEALEVARGALYPGGALAHVPDEWRWGFEPAGDDWRVAPEVARTVTFERRNLADAIFPRGFDVIWCRNVLIYFGADARDAVVDKLVDSLNPGGFLFVGYAETLRDTPTLEAISACDTVLYRKRTRIAHPTPPPRSPPPHTPNPTPVPRSPTPPPTSAVVRLRGRYDDDDRLARELAAALSGAHTSVTIDLDHADYLGDGAAAVLRRARSAARAAGVTVTLTATRPGPLRWLKRAGLDTDEDAG